jgi:hypothetical protein
MHVTEPLAAQEGDRWNAEHIRYRDHPRSS